MSNATQYGQTIFLEGLQTSSSAKKLRRVHFSKNGAEGVLYNEAWLQHLIMKHPSVLPIDQIEPIFCDLVPICVELPMRSGSLDNLLVTPKGDIALIECKLWRNPEARREVVGQIIDYATEMSNWTYDDLQEAITRTRSLDNSDEKKTRRLYELVSAKEEIDEASFHDAVSRNLKRGRFLLLIVGDGIREEVEAMTEFLQQYAGLHFTLGVVELALFEVPIPDGGYIVQPRILARTTNIDRGIVTIDNGQIAVKPPNAGSSAAVEAMPNKTGKRTTITQERYFEQIENSLPGITPKLRAFIDDLPNDVSTEFGTANMILRWHSAARSWNLGAISTSGQVWMEYIGQQANDAGLPDLGKQYLATLAGLVPGAFVKKNGTAWNVAAQDGKSIPVDELLKDETRKNGWLRAITDFQEAVMRASPDN